MNARIVTFGFYLATFVALVDQGAKWWLLNYVMKPPHVEHVTSFLNFVLTYNKGVTFGLLNSGHPYMPYVFVATSVIILLLLLNWLIHTDSMIVGTGLGLVMGGAIGNIIDRVNYGGVVDFIDFHIYGYHWYAFNIADSAIVTGVGLLLLENLVMTKKKG